MNLIHSLELDSFRSERLFQTVAKRYHSCAEAFDIADLASLAHQNLVYFEDKYLRVLLKNNQKEIIQPEFDDVQSELQKVVDMQLDIYGRAAQLKANMNLLDIKALFGSVTRFCDIIAECAGLNTKEILEKYPQIVQLLEALMENFISLKQSIDLSDIHVFVKGLFVVAEVQTEESVEFCQELKYRLKRALEKNRPRGLVDDMKKDAKKITGHPSLLKTFQNVLG